MYRLIIALVVLLLSIAALAAPAPQPFTIGWDKPVDPDNDCKFTRDKDSLIIEFPGTDHDIDPCREQYNAPRLLRDIEGDFVMQVRVRLDCCPSAESTVEREPSRVAAGFLLILPDGIYICQEYGFERQRRESNPYAALRSLYPSLGRSSLIWNPLWKNWPLTAKAQQAYLKLERRGEALYPSLGPDDEEWTLFVGRPRLPKLPAKLKVGLAAYSTSTEPFECRFDQFKLIRNQRKRR